MKQFAKTYQLNVHIYWTAFLQSIQQSLSAEYYFYKTGEIPYDKLLVVLAKLDDYYRLSDTIPERFERYKLGFSTTVIHLLRMENSIKFILMCRANASKTGIFFEREQYADARNPSTRINLNQCYEVLRINKEVYDISTKQSHIDNGVWTVGLTHQEKERIYKDFNAALIKRNYKLIKQICYGLHHLIGFAEVRKAYGELKLKLEKRFTKFMSSQHWSQYKVLSDLYKLPAKIGYVKRVKTDYVNVQNLLMLQTMKKDQASIQTGKVTKKEV